MPEHKIGSREEWQATRDELAELEAEPERNQEIKRKRLDPPGSRSRELRATVGPNGDRKGLR